MNDNIQQIVQKLADSIGVSSEQLLDIYTRAVYADAAIVIWCAAAVFIIYAVAMLFVSRADTGISNRMGLIFLSAFFIQVAIAMLTCHWSDYIVPEKQAIVDIIRDVERLAIKK